MIAPVKKFSGARLSTDFRGKVHKQKAFVKFCNRFACFTFQHLRKSSRCPTSKFWTLWGSGDKYYTVDLSGSGNFTMKQRGFWLQSVWARLQPSRCNISFEHFLVCSGVILTGQIAVFLYFCTLCWYGLPFWTASWSFCLKLIILR